jgi:hypothetical protein
MNRAFVSAAALVLATPAFAGITLKWDQTKASGETSEYTMQCEGKKATFKTSSKSSDSIIWDGDPQLLWTLKTDEKTYRRIDMKEMQARMGAGREQMAAAMANMPPEKRAQMEAMMAGRMGAAAAPPSPREPAKFTATGKKAKIGTWNCEWNQVSTGGSNYQACVVPWAAAKVSKDDLACFSSIADTMAGLLRGMTGGPAQPQQDSTMLDVHSWPGVIVASERTGADGKQTMTLKSVSKGSVPEATFKVPEGYKEIPMK